MDLTTLIGVLVGTFLIAQGIELDGLDSFYDIKSVLIVVGGTLAATVASYLLSILVDVPKHIMVLFHRRQYNIPKLVDQLINFAMITRQSGLLALEEKVEEIKNPLFKQSILMIMDTSDSNKARLILERGLENMITRHDAAAGLYKKAPMYAPAFDVVGTLVGLVNMLGSLNLDGSGGASSPGKDMSITLITTFYGSVLSNLVFHLIARKSRIRQNGGELCYSVIIKGIIAIQSGENPKHLREYLLASLKQSQQKKLLSKAAKNTPEGSEGN